MSKLDMDIILDLLKEVREDQKEQGKELNKQSSYLVSLDGDIKELKETVAFNTRDIAHHISRTDGLQNLHEDNKKRIDQNDQMIAIMGVRVEKLEEPVKAKEWIKKNVVAIFAVISALVSIAALILERYK